MLHLYLFLILMSFVQDLENVCGALDFEWWLNGHSDTIRPPFKFVDHNPENALIAGLGNVALDVNTY